MTDPRGKFKPNWEGPYLVKKLFSKGAAILSDLKGNEFKEPINLDKLKKLLSVDILLDQKPHKRWSRKKLGTNKRRESEENS